MIIVFYSTWSTGRSIGDGWPDPSSDNENKDWSVAQPTSAATAYTDLVQEFEPGKPWKVKLLIYIKCKHIQAEV